MTMQQNPSYILIPHTRVIGGRGSIHKIPSACLKLMLMCTYATIGAHPRNAVEMRTMELIGELRGDNPELRPGVKTRFIE